jgi:hypothetical protein
MQKHEPEIPGDYAKNAAKASATQPFFVLIVFISKVM